MAKELWYWVLETLGSFWRSLKKGVSTLFGYLGLGVSSIPKSYWLRGLIALPLIFFFYIFASVFFVHRIDDRYNLMDNRQGPLPVGASEAVAITEALVNRETRENNWMVNDPPFLPGWWIDNAPNFQRGMMGAASRFTIELRDHLGRTRGSSAEDPDLEKAAGNLTRELDRWIIDFSTSLLPTTPSDTYFREGADLLGSYNARLAAGNAVFDRRADNLMATLDRIALDLGASSASLDDYIRANAGSLGFDTQSDDLFYRVKGQVYAYSYIMIGLKRDFSQVIQDKDLGPLFDQMLSSLKAAASLDPLMVMNGEIHGAAANHLAMMGFYLLRARTQLREVTSILLT